MSRIGLPFQIEDKVLCTKDELYAEVQDGEVTGWRPIVLNHLNADIDACISYLKGIKNVMERSKD